MDRIQGGRNKHRRLSTVLTSVTHPTDPNTSLPSSLPLSPSLHTGAPPVCDRYAHLSALHAYLPPHLRLRAGAARRSRSVSPTRSTPPPPRLLAVAVRPDNASSTTSSALHSTASAIDRHVPAELPPLPALVPAAIAPTDGGASTASPPTTARGLYEVPQAPREFRIQTDPTAEQPPPFRLGAAGPGVGCVGPEVQPLRLAAALFEIGFGTVAVDLILVPLVRGSRRNHAEGEGGGGGGGEFRLSERVTLTGGTTAPAPDGQHYSGNTTPFARW